MSCNKLSLLDTIVLPVHNVNGGEVPVIYLVKVFLNISNSNLAFVIKDSKVWAYECN